MVATMDWGLNQPAHSAAAAAPFDLPGDVPTDRLPEVEQLVADGWELAPEAPMFAYLPAVWPRDLRAWVPDRAARFEERSVVDPATHQLRSKTVAVASSDAWAEEENDQDAVLEQAGITMSS